MINFAIAFDAVRKAARRSSFNLRSCAFLNSLRLPAIEPLACCTAENVRCSKAWRAGVRIETDLREYA